MEGLSNSDVALLSQREDGMLNGGSWMWVLDVVPGDPYPARRWQSLRW